MSANYVTVELINAVIDIAVRRFLKLLSTLAGSALAFLGAQPKI